MHCSICEIDSNIFSGTFYSHYEGPLSKEKRTPTSESGRWLYREGVVFEIIRYCPRCYDKYCLKKDIYLSRDGNE